MLPTFRPGEHLLINRFIYKIEKPKEGDVIVLKDPRDAQRLLLKRIAEIQNNILNVISDNTEEGSDSRIFGATDKKNIVGKVFFRY